METKLTLDRIEEGQAVLLTDAKEKIYLPVRLLPSTAQEGNVYFLNLDDKPEQTKDAKEQAKAILNEILGGKK